MTQRLNLRNNKNIFMCLIFLFIISSSIFSIFCFNLINNSIEVKNHKGIHLLADDEITKQWIENPTFETPIDPWVVIEGGDTSDVDSNIILGHANSKIIGNQRSFSLISDPPTTTNWTEVQNPAFPDFPDNHGIDPYGCYANHDWDEEDDQSPSVHWDRNITMPVDMSDYYITSASVSAIVNASAQAIEGGTGGIEAPGDNDIEDYATHDYVRFYVLFSDLEKNKVYEVAYNQTYNLGQDDPNPEINSTSDTFMITVPEEFIIFYLTSVLSTDNYNFTITLGIKIWCEDNIYSDQDTWENLRINSFNLSFTYEKKIDKFSTLSWKQIGDEISKTEGKDIEILDGNLKFKYKIDNAWPSDSPNSEIRIIISDNLHLETVKLSSATTSFQEVEQDVKSLILTGVKITLIIQVFLADDFGLDQNITVSFDDVYLEISYIEIEQVADLTSVIVILVVGMVVLIGVFTLYEMHYKYPPMVRKVRTLRKKLQKRKTVKKPLMMRNRSTMVNDSIQNNLKVLKFTAIPEKMDQLDSASSVKPDLKMK